MSLVPTAGTEPLPGYRLLARLGKGGYGEVWKASGPGGFKVALKFVPLEDSAGAIELKALDVIRDIRHPNLLSTVGSWQIDGTLIIAMELADRTLLDCFRDAVAEGHAGIPGPELIEYFAEAAKGIDFLNEPRHALGDRQAVSIQHRDIKPQNLLLAGGGVKVGDFGLAKFHERSVSPHSGSLTFSYAAPEFFRGETSKQSDQYSLAVTYCHLRGGQLPFTGSAAEVMTGHLVQEPDLTMLPEDERPVVARALAKEPAKRWPNCREFVHALRACPSLVAPARVTAGVGASPVATILRPATGRPDPFMTPSPDEFMAVPESTISASDDATARPAAIATGTPPARPSLEPPVRPAPVGGWRPKEKQKAGGSKAGIFSALGALSVLAAGIVLWAGGFITPNGNDEPTPPVKPTAPDVAIDEPVKPPKVNEAQTKIEPAPMPVVEKREPAVINQPAISPSLRLEMPGSLTLDAGEKKQFKIKVGRENIEGPVTVKFGGLPKGVILNEASILAKAAEVTVEIAAAIDAAKADGPIQVRASIGDAVVRDERLNLIVKPWTPGEVRRFVGHEGPVRSVALSRDGRRALSGSHDKSVRLWDVQTGNMLQQFAGHTDFVNCVAFSPDGRRALSASDDSTVRLWAVETGQELHNLVGQNYVYSVAFTPDGRHALSGSQEKTLRLWQLDSGKEIQGIEIDYPDVEVYTVAFSRDGHRALSGGSDHAVRLWEVTSEPRLVRRRSLTGHQGFVRSVAFSPDGRRALSASDDKTVILWDIETGQLLHRFQGHQETVNSVCFSPDGRRAISAAVDKTIRVWDIGSKKEIQTLEGHADAVTSVVFAPDGRHAISGSVDKTVRLWRLPLLSDK